MTEKSIGWHSVDVAEPSPLSLHDDVLHGVDVGSAADFYIGDFMLPMQTKNPLQTADVKDLKGFDVMPV